MIYDEVKQLVTELVQLPREDFYPVKLLVVGASSSEIIGGKIGSLSSPEVGEQVASAVLDAAKELGFSACFQCCEHLNRALVMEREECERQGFEQVCAVPFPKAGGSLASAAYRLMKSPVLVSEVKADAGLDIGQTLVGMHLKRVAVPVRLSRKTAGEAIITCARTRPALIGGERAKYKL